MRYRKILVAAALGAGIAAVSASPALASVTPGAFCKKSLAGTTDKAADGDSYICSKTAADSRYRWRPLADSAPTGPDDATTDEGSVTGGKGKTLPKTGPGDVVISSAAGAGLLGAGGAVYYLNRRRKTRFVA